MTELSTEDILGEKETHHPSSITSLSFRHKALSHLSCLSDFKNLERLDLTFNSVTSLKGLESCFNLKWLSVQQNKLHSLKGIERLINLNVLNAGKNKLTSMDEVKNLVKLRALILNDNEIASISGLDQLMELNTLVLSRNPIRKVGNSLAKLKSITKISLSSCQLEDIDSSIKACIGLEQLRLANNDIKTLPAELAYCNKLQILDLGNNMISRWLDLEVLSSLHNLTNLNLLGNPVAEKVKLVNKVKRLVPRLQILNSKRMDKLCSGKDQKVEDDVGSLGNESKSLKDKKKNYDAKLREARPKKNSMDVDSGNHLGLNDDDELAKDGVLDANNASCEGTEKPGRNSKLVQCNTNALNEKCYQLGERRDQMKKEKDSRKGRTGQESEREPDVAVAENDGENEHKKHKKKKEKRVEKEVMVQEADQIVKEKRSKRKIEKTHLDVIDDKETSFAELIAYDANVSMKPNDGRRGDIQTVGKFDAISALVSYPAKTKKRKNQVAGASVLQFLTPEVGMGGPSAWIDDDE